MASLSEVVRANLVVNALVIVVFILSSGVFGMPTSFELRRAIWTVSIPRTVCLFRRLLGVTDG